MLSPSNKKNVSFVSISRSRSLTAFFSLSFAGFLLLSLFLCLTLALYSKLVDMTINVRIQRRFPLSAFVFIDSLVVSASQDAGDYAISRQNNLELHLGCHTCLLSYFTLAYLWCGRTVGRAYGHVITKFSPMGSLPHFLTHGTSRARAPLIMSVSLIP